jgi:hypothetical protein
VAGQNYDVLIEEEILLTNLDFTKINLDINNGQSVSFDSFKILGSFVEKYAASISDTLKKEMLNRIELSFNDTNTTKIYLTIDQLNKTIPLNKRLTATQVSITASVDITAVKAFDLNSSFYFNKIQIFEANEIVTIYQ